MSVATVKFSNGQEYKLGRIRPLSQTDFENQVVTVLPNGQVVRTLKLRRYYNAARDAAPPPPHIDYATKAMASLKRVYLNDRYGDCVIAGKYHQVGVWSANDNTQGEQPPVVGTDQEVLDAYHRICGPGDNGCVITEVLDAFKTTGLSFNGVIHKIDDYVAVDHTDKNMVMVALEVFGGGTIGIDLPSDWTCTNCTWDMTNSRIVGGHDVCVIDYNETGPRIATWGGIVQMTWAAFTSRRWITEFYVPLSPDWYGKDNLAPNGINVQSLKEDLDKLRQGIVPDPGPVTPPPPCPAGQHWDAAANKCVPDTPPPPPPPPPQGYVVKIPAQQGFLFGRPLVSIPALTVPATPVSGLPMAGAQLTLPPFVLRLLQLACTGAITLPPPWNMLLATLCGLLPHNAEAMVAAGQSAAITLPPWLLPIIKGLCTQAGNLPAPWNALAAMVCGLVPAKSPCGCH